MIAKDSLRVTHGKLTSKTIERAGKTLKYCDIILEEYNKSLEKYFGKPSNTQLKIHNDLAIMVTDLKKEELFQNKPGMCFQSFPKCSGDKYNSLTGCKFAAWLTAKKEDLAKARHLMDNLSTFPEISSEIDSLEYDNVTNKVSYDKYISELMIR